MISIVKVKEDLTGRTINRLTVLYQTEDYVAPNGKHYARYHCQCNCDNHTETDVLAKDIKNGYIKSCGCLQKEKVKRIGLKNKKYNEYKISNNIVYIYLNNSNEYTVIDLDKWNEIPYIREFYWYKNRNGYVYTTIPQKYITQFQKKNIFLHNLICPCEEGYEPDHLDRNKLNNLAENLMPKVHMQNMQNQGVKSNNKSGYKGVCWHKRDSKWYANITVNKQRIYLGSFIDLQDAVRVRKEAENKYFN